MAAGQESRRAKVSEQRSVAFRHIVTVVLVPSAELLLAVLFLDRLGLPVIVVFIVVFIVVVIVPWLAMLRPGAPADPGRRGRDVSVRAAIGT